MNSKQCDAANETAAEFTWLARSEKCDFVEDLGGGKRARPLLWVNTGLPSW